MRALTHMHTSVIEEYLHPYMHTCPPPSHPILHPSTWHAHAHAFYMNVHVRAGLANGGEVEQQAGHSAQLQQLQAVLATLPQHRQ